MEPVKHPPANPKTQACPSLSQGCQGSSREIQSLLQEDQILGPPGHRALGSAGGAALPPPTQKPDLFCPTYVFRVKETAKLPMNETLSARRGGEDQGGELPHSSAPPRGMLSREPAPLFYTLGHRPPLPPTAPISPFCKYVKRKTMQTSEVAGAAPSSRDF